MMNANAVGPGTLAAPNLPLGDGSTGLSVLLDRSSGTARRSATGLAVKPSFSTGRLASAMGKAPVAEQSAEQVKATAQAYIDKCWKNYAKLYPEAFSPRGGVLAKTPTLIFLQTQAELDQEFGKETGPNELVAFVKYSDPAHVYVHTAKLVKLVNKVGPESVTSTIAHELIHSLTNAINLRMRGDVAGKSASYQGVREDLELNFSFDARKSPEIKASFSVRELITEFAAERYSNKATGVASAFLAYAPIRATGEKLIQLVGDAVFRKAVFENDPTAFRRVVAAAKILQAQNVKTSLLEAKREMADGLRAVQAATPLGKPLTAASIDKLQTRYVREINLRDLLAESFPDEIKLFDFRLSKAVDSNLKSRGKSYDPDLGEAGQRELSVSIRAVWPMLARGAN